MRTHASHHAGCERRVELLVGTIERDIYEQNFLIILIESANDVHIADQGSAKDIFQN